MRFTVLALDYDGIIGQVTLFAGVDRMSVPSQGLAPGRVRATVAAEVARINAQRAAQANGSCYWGASRKAL